MQKPTLYILLLSIAATILGIGFILVLALLNPSRLVNLIMFYLILGGFAFSIFALAGVYLRLWRGPREMISSYLRASIRQALLLALILLVSLLLLSRHLFSWLNAALLIIALIFFEFYIAAKNR